MSGAKYKIGFLVNDAGSEYSKALIQGISQACKKNNCTLFIFPVGEFGKCYDQFGYQRRAVASFIQKNNLDAVLFSSTTQGTHVTNDALYEYIRSFSSVKIVSIGVAVPDIHSIIVDCKPGLDALISHLIENHGCKRIALMAAGENSVEAEERTEIYKEVLARHNIPFDESLVLYGFFAYSLAFKAMIDYANQYGGIDFDAIVCLNDNMAYGCVDYCNQHNIAVPEKIKITGFDDIAKTAMSNPTISTVNQQLEMQGYISLETALDLIEGRETPLVQTVPTKVRYRQSCGCVDISDGFTDYKTEDFSSVSKDDSFHASNIGDWLIRKDQLIQIENYYSNTQTRINLYEFTGNFQFVLNNFDIGAAAAVLYEEPYKQSEIFDYFDMPHSASLLAAYDNGRNFFYKRDADTPFFDPNEYMLPPGFMEFDAEPYFVVALSHCELQYGYLIYKMGSYDETMYDFICTIFSSQLSSAYEFTKSEEERQRLNNNNLLLQHISRTDELTGILNRRGFMELGQEAINLSVKRNRSGLVIFGDMDGLKKINDTFGHDFGDKAICSEAQLLTAIFRNNDIIGRIGGDEFAIVAPGMDLKQFKKLQDKLAKVCAEWNAATDEPFELSISIGCSMFTPESFALGVLLQEADVQQYKEKRIKKSRQAAK